MASPICRFVPSLIDLLGPLECPLSFGVACQKFAAQRVCIACKGNSEDGNRLWDPVQWPTGLQGFPAFNATLFAVDRTRVITCRGKRIA